MIKRASILVLTAALCGCAVTPTQFDTEVLELNPDRPIGFYFPSQVTLDDKVDESGGYAAAGLIGFAITAAINASARNEYENYFEELEKHLEAENFTETAYSELTSFIESDEFPANASLEYVESAGIRGEGAVVTINHGFSSKFDRFRVIMQYTTRTVSDVSAGVGNPEKAEMVGKYKTRSYIALVGPDTEGESDFDYEAYWQQDRSAPVRQAVNQGIEQLIQLFRNDVANQLEVPEDSEEVKFSEGRFLLNGNTVSESEGRWTVECSNIDLGICYAVVPSHLEYVPSGNSGPDCVAC